MDPTEVAKFIINALREDNLPEAAMAMEDLQNWLARGGFAPESGVLAELMKEILNSWSRLHSGDLTPKSVNIDLELELARSYFGKLAPAIKRRLKAVVNNPTQETWSNAHSIILNPRSRTRTLWQAVMAVDPTFPNVGPSPGEEWERIPSQDLLVRALKFVTH